MGSIVFFRLGVEYQVKNIIEFEIFLAGLWTDLIKKSTQIKNNLIIIA